MRVPRNAVGLLEGPAEVERGIRIALLSGGSVAVYADMNALEFKSPAEAAASRTGSDLYEGCSAGPVVRAHVGRLIGAAVRLRCGEQVIRYAVAFRPGGGPIYWLRLETDTYRKPIETKAFDGIAASFRLIRWQ